MKMQKKLKTDITQYVIFMSLTTLLLIAALLIRQSFVYEDKILIFGIIISLIACIPLFIGLRTSNPGFIILSLSGFLLGISYLTDYKGIWVISIFIILSIFYGIYLFGNRTKWRRKQLLELAAKPVETTLNGYTGRPFPAGNLDYSHSELVALGRFLKKYLIAFPYEQEDGIIFRITDFRYLFFKKLSIKSDTYVAFGNDGKIAVNIALKDYHRYREELTFDQLCKSLALLFENFLQLHRDGESIKILKLLDD